MQVGFIGAGNMARALARGWGEPVLASDAGSGRAEALVQELGGEALSNRELAERADIVVLCHKPYQLEQVAQDIAAKAKLIASVVGGTPVTQLEQAYPDTPVFSLIPNTAVEVRRGIICYAKPDPPAEREDEVLALFSRLGRVVALQGRALEAATAIASVGPAYQALLVEAQVDAGVRYGLNAQLASELVVETMAGSAALLEKRDYDTLAVRREVTSPGGTTARGLEALERHGVRTAFQAAIDAVRDWP